MTGFRSLLQEALAQRRAIELPKTGRLVVALVACVTLYIAAAIVLTPTGAARWFHFREERGLVTVLSAIFLAMATGFAFAAFFVSRGAVPRIRYFWLLTTLAVGFLAFDELLGFHERLGARLDRKAVLADTIDVAFRSWDDIIVVVYGLIALPLLIYFLPSVLRYPLLAERLVAAFLLYCIHTFIDATQEPPTTLSVMLEESAKLYCAAFIALALFTGLLGAIRKESLSSRRMG